MISTRTKLLSLFVLTALAATKLGLVNAAILTPPYFNLVANKRVTATATCGEGVREPELYCKLTGSSATDREASSYANLIQGQYCEYCDPNDPEKNHHANYSIDGTDKWWQSPPLSRSLDFNQVNLTIDFGQEFHVAYIYIKMANSPRPGVWALEKSTDYGQTYQPWQYFADTPSDCYNFFNATANRRIATDDDVICTTDYSKVLPVEGGEILVSLVNNRPNAKNFTHADLLQKWTRATNVRLRLMRTKNLLGHLMAVAKQDPTVTRRYFYSIRDISIGGRCVCNGHAQQCEASNPFTPDKLICRCSHNTCGDQCETCCDGFVQKKWQPNREGQEFECEPCQCYGHSNTCVYDPEVDKNNLSIDIHGNYSGGGVCQECEHNTQGINCHECKPGYYRPFGVSISSMDACRRCDCDNPYSTGNCAPLTGECECKSQYTGYKCQECANGYTDWPTCRKCDCDINGRSDQKCNAPCNCKFGYLGPYCDQCMERYFGFPNCRPCDCDREGTLDYNCHKETGQCVCRPGYTGVRCDMCADGYFGERMCKLCECDVGTVREVCDKSTGACLCEANFAGERCNECAPGFYNFPQCLPCECDVDGSRGPSCTYYGNQQQCSCKEGRSGPKCDQCAPGYYKYPDCFPCQCDESGTIGQSCDPFTGKCNCKSNFANDKCSECAPDFFNYPFCERCSCHPKGTADHFPGCNKELRMAAGIVCPCKEYVTGRQCDKCKDRYYGLGSDSEKGCSRCECNRDGTLNELDLCDLNSGQCVCKLFVDETACKECKPGFFSLERNNIFGCQECGCHPGTSYDNNCDRQTGQCACLPNMVGQKCDQPASGHYIPDLHQLKFEIEDGLAKGKKVRYGFDEDTFPLFSWKGYVHLNKVTGDVSQNVSISKPGTYRMVVRYLNKNPNISDISIRVRELRQQQGRGGEGEEQDDRSQSGDQDQHATLYLLPNTQPSFETVTVDKINALILELEKADYEFSFGSQLDNLYIDYFVLIPSHYYESTVLRHDVIRACEDYRNDDEACIQYKYPSIESFAPTRLFDPDTDSVDSTRMINLDVMKEFNHSYALPAIAYKLNNQNTISRSVRLPPGNNPGPYVLVVDFMNLNNDGQQINVEVVGGTADNRRQNGKVYLYKCNITTLCREVILSNEFNEPLAIEASREVGSVTVTLRASGREVLVNQMALIPKDKFDVNYIKMAPYCKVKNKKCHPLEYSRFVFNRIEAETVTSAARQDPSRVSDPSLEYIPLDKVIYLHNYFPEVTIPVDAQQNRQSGGEQILLVHYYQPNHPNVPVTVFLDKQTNGTFVAPYCPSTSGCRAIVKFSPNTETFSAEYISTLTFQLAQNGHDIWIDYALLASATDVTPDIFSYVPVDRTSEFIERCASQQHFFIQFQTSEFCDHSVMSLSVKYNDGALPCGCDPQGTQSDAVEFCSMFGGKCRCRENVIGRQCNRCKTGYFGFPNCRKCDCPTGNCDDETGECVSPPNSFRNECNDGYHGFHPIYGCDECACELDGTVDRSSICDKQTGQCVCRENTDGLRCEKCKAGFFNYPRCDQCDCHEEGSLAQICDPTTAQCLCKENTFGDRCEHCKPGTFNLEARNPKGCTPCFCFGQTSQCVMATLYYTPLKDMSGEWRLAHAKSHANQSDISVGFQRDGENTLSLGGGESSGSGDSTLSDTIYWSAPSTYTGNKVTSYGGTIRYKIRISPPENSASAQIKPDLILVGASNMSLAHTSLLQPSSDDAVFSNSIDLIESKFNHLQTGSAATREQLMIVLASLVEVKLRASYYPRLHSSRLVEFTFDVGVDNYEAAANSTSATADASGAEMCYCPPNYRGYSCESCEYGYYKVKGNGPGLFNCVPCNCNGHTDRCDQETGECLECRDNTEGTNCERCKLGHYKIEHENGVSECRLCPCPGPYHTNVFADSCMYDANSQKVYYCACAPGYYGQFCERCAPGFYGDPTVPGGKCLPCECNGNIDLNAFDSCDQRTGACLKCLNNTAGVRCDQCADWHWGDPLVAKSCQPCECDRVGTDVCDIETGDCTCKPGVIGHNCATCGPNMWGFAYGDGCKACECDPVGSVSTQCDAQTGKCACKPGVGGKKCDKCLEDHWNFTVSGCQKCKCEKSGVKVTNTGGFACNSTTGHCTCIEGVKGQLCDRCDDRWVLVKHVGCKKCDTCVNTLLDDVNELVIKADGIESGNKDSSLTFKANSKLAKLESELNAIKESIDPSQYDQTPLVLLQRSIKTVQTDLLGLKLMTEYNINDKIKLLTRLLADAELFNKDISDLRIKLDILDKIIDDLDREDDKNYKNITDEQLLIYENLVDQIVKRDFSSTVNRFNELLGEFNSANESVQALVGSYRNQTGQVDSIKSKNTYIQNSLMELKAHVDKAKSLEKFRDQDVEFKAYYDNLNKIRNESSQLQSNSENTLKEIEEVIRKGKEKLTQSNKDLSDLNSKIEDLQELYKDHDTKYVELKGKCHLAEQNSQSLYKMASEWRNKVLSAQQGLEAFEMVKSYERIADSLERAHNNSQHVYDKYTAAKASMDELSTKADELKNRNQALTTRLNDELEKKVKAESDYVRLNGQYTELESKAKQLNKSLARLDEWINKTVDSDQTLNSLKRELDTQQADLASSGKVADDLIRRIQSLDSLRNSLRPDNTNSNPDESSNNNNNDQQLVQSIEKSIESLQASGPAINQTIKKLLDESNFNAELEKISKDIYDLRILIESTRQIANNIKVAVNFNDSTVINLKPPLDLHPAMSTTGSIYVKTRDPYAPIALIYNESNPNEYVSLYIQQGRPHFQYRLAGEDLSQPATVVSTDVAINNDEWHKIEIERTGRAAKLRVYSEQGAGVPREASVESAHKSVVLNLDSSNAKFVLGQFSFANIPDDLRTIAAYNNQFRGAMDAFRFNGHQMGLWNYLQAKNIKGEMNRKFRAQSDIDESNENAAAATSPGETGVYFADEDAFMCRNGSKIKFSGRNRPNLDVTVRFKTESPNGLLWLWYNDERHYLSIYLQSGHINVAFSTSAENKLVLFERIPAPASYRLDDNKYHTIQVTISRNPKANVISEIRFKVVERFDTEQETVIDEKLYQTNNKYYTISNGKQCIGGMLATDRESIFKDSQFDSFTGCYVSVAISMVGLFDRLVLNELLHKTGIKSFNVAPDCPTTSDQCEVRKSSQPAFVEFAVSRRGDASESVGVSFVTASPSGVIFYRKIGSRTSLLAQLRDGRVVLTVYGGADASVRSRGTKLNDNRLHHVYVRVSDGIIELRVDNKLEGTSPFNLIDQSDGSRDAKLYIAGVPTSARTESTSSAETFDNFEGCIIEVIYDDKKLDFAKAASKSTTSSVRLSKCFKTQQRSSLSIPGYKEFQGPALNRYSQTVKPGGQASNDVLPNEECALSKQYDTTQMRAVGHRFGLTRSSRLEVNEAFPIAITTFVSFKFRTLQPDGLMFYASDASSFSDFIAAWLQDGYVNYAFDCGSGFMHLRSRRLYNDGRYHTIMLRRDRQSGALVIADRTNTSVLERLESTAQGDASSLSVVEPYYFGGIPDTDRALLPSAQLDLINFDPFIGCMSDFNIAYKVLRKNLEKVDLMSCANNHESGVFFTGITPTTFASLVDGGVSLAEPFDVSFEMKSRTKNGVVAYLSSRGDGDSTNYALLELVNGELVYKMVVDDQETVVRFVPDESRAQLCNSSWIRVRVRRDERGIIGLELRGLESTGLVSHELLPLVEKLTSHSVLYLGALPSK